MRYLIWLLPLLLIGCTLNVSDGTTTERVRELTIEGGTGIETELNQSVLTVTNTDKWHTLVDFTTTSASSSITFSSLPYRQFYRLTVTGQNTNNSVPLAFWRLRFNSDSGNNYSWTRIYSCDGISGAGTEQATNDNGYMFVSMPGRQTNNNRVGNASVIIDNTTNNQRGFYGSYVLLPSNSNDVCRVSTAARWFTTATITSITVLTNTFNIATGTRFIIEGVE